MARTRGVASDCGVHRHDEVEDVLDGLEQVLAVVDLNVKFVLDGVMDEHARLDVHLVVLVVPVRLECDRHAVPPVGVDVAQALAANLDDALGHHVRLLVQVNVVLVGVVEVAHGAHRGNLLQTHLLRHLLEHLQHHFLLLIIKCN